MSRVEVIPAELLSCDRKEEVIGFILSLPCREIDRKEIFIDWCRYCGCELRREDVLRVYPPG
jgi:hypothetical protein